MCGIYGHFRKKGKENPLLVCLEGLKRLEYRGYDSAGIAALQDGKIISYKAVGKVAMLDQRVQSNQQELCVAIAHTRWATHGKSSEENAHPHYDQTHSIALVHNGIVENYLEIKNDLEAKGFLFTSETDTEVISQLVASNYKGNILKALQKSLKRIQGSFAIALIHKDHPDVILAASRSCPLVIGFCPKTKDVFLSSDTSAFYGRTLDVFYLSDNEIAMVTPKHIHVYNEKGAKLTKETEPLALEDQSISKEGYEHFMRKEIFEQPDELKKTLAGRYDPVTNLPCLEEITLSTDQICLLKQIYILACGTSYHAGLIAASFLQSCLQIPVSVFIASEFRYSNPIITKETLIIALSQSGETADTIAALRATLDSEAPTIGITNVKNSLLARSVNIPLIIRATSEISVCSTKTFTCQLALLYILALELGKRRGLSLDICKAHTETLLKLPAQITSVLQKEPAIVELAKLYKSYSTFFFIGRQEMYPTSMEAALKFKEITYCNANAYPAGEMKHGPIALINPDLPTIAFCGSQRLQEKMASNLMEIKARGGPILAIIPESASAIASIATDTFTLPSDLSDTFSAIPYSIFGQLFAYHLANFLGREIDQPRNLAKSVTVE